MPDEFRCPRCGGRYYGRDASTDRIDCHADEQGRSYSRSDEEIEAMAGGVVTRRGKRCGWTGTTSECGLSPSENK